MMTIPVLGFLLLAAHVFRAGLQGLALTLALLGFLPLVIRTRWAYQVNGLLLGAGALEWVRTIVSVAGIRMQFGMPWIRMAIILGTVVLFTLLGAWVLLRKRTRVASKDPAETPGLSTAVFLLTGGILSFIQWKVPLDMLLLNRFFPGYGWLEILALATYGAVLVNRMHNPKQQAIWRVRAWRLFSAVFFGQLILGLSGLDNFLMTGKLHLPVPALIAAGPIYRGYGFFMPILFLSTIILVGPAWCSHLCYIGAWDDAAARTVKRPGWHRNDGLRMVIAAVVIGSAILLRVMGVHWLAATLLAGAFGLAGVGVMMMASRRKGTMIHCTVYCPIGLLADWLGKLNPFRIRIDHSGCTECMACARVCRYSALQLTDIRSGQPSLTCTLCGDCVTDCPQNTIAFHFPGLGPHAARNLFLILIVTLHTVFLGVARI